MRNDEQSLAAATEVKTLADLLVCQTVNYMNLYSQIVEKNNQILGLRRLLEYEKMTGLFTRYYFEQQAEEMMSRTYERRSLNSGRTLAVVMIDLDFFKVINDTFGHHCGDEVLCVFGGIIRQRVRSRDIACRWGGDEFALLFEGVTVWYVERVATELRTALEKADFSFNRGLPREKQVHPTFSHGTAFQSSEKEPFPALLQTADAVLYERRGVRRR